MSETSYTIERAKSGRSMCKKCKEKIGKGEIRLGVHAPGPGDYNLSSWYHPKCYSVPRKLVKQGMDAETFVKELLMDETGDKCLVDTEEEIIQAIKSKHVTVKSESKSEVTSSSNSITKIKKDLEKIRKAREAGDEDDIKPKKKSKKEPSNTDESIHILDENDIAVAKVYEIYENYKNDELKDVLRWNRQLVSGAKQLLLQRIIDGHMNGRLGMCPSCFEGKLKLKDEDGETVFCNGYYDKDAMVRNPCFFTCPRVEAPRLKPWFTEKPTEEQEEEIDASMGKSDSKDSKGAGGNPSLSDLQSLAKEMDDSGDWDISSPAGMKASAKAMVKLCTGKLDLPSDEKKAIMETGKLILQNRGLPASGFVDILADKFGLIKANADAKQRKTDSISAACKHPANGPVMLVILELGSLYFKAGNSNAGTTYKKVAEAVKNLDFEINSNNAKGLGKGKTKVSGIGKGSAEKIYEFITTGTIEKLEEKRAST